MNKNYYIKIYPLNGFSNAGVDRVVCVEYILPCIYMEDKLYNVWINLFY